MNCNTAKKLLDEYLSLSLSPELTTELEEHLYHCSACRQLVEEWDTMREAIRTEYQLIYNSVPESRLTRIYNAVQAQIERTEKGSIWRWVKGLPAKLWVSPAMSWQIVRVSAVLILGIFIGMFFLRSSEVVTPPLEKTSVPASVSPAEKKTELAEAPISRPIELLEPQPTPEIMNKLPAVQVTPIGIIKSPLEKASMPIEKEFSVAQINEPIKEIQTPDNFIQQPPSSIIPAVDPRIEEIKMLAAELRDTRAVDRLQQVKLQLMLAGRTDAIAQLHQLEGTMMKLISTEEKQKAAQLETLSRYQQAELDLLNRDYISALQNYYSVVAEAPNSYLAFLSHYQIANIKYEHQADYSGALAEYQICLQNYPPHYFSPEQQKITLERIAILNENAADGWRPLHLYMQAKKNRLDVGLVLYKELLLTYPKLKISKNAAQELVTEILSRQFETTAEPLKVINMFQEIMAKITETSLKQQLQMGIADIFNYRLMNPQQAILEYTRAIQIDRNSSLALAAQQRIRDIYNSSNITNY